MELSVQINKNRMFHINLRKMICTFDCNGLKCRTVCFLVCFILLVLLPIHAHADNITKYDLSELGMSVSIPSEYVVFTRDIDANNPNLSKYGFTKSSLSSFMKERNIFLNGWNEDLSHEIIITMIDSSLDNFNQFSDAELSTIAASLDSQYEDIGITVIKTDIYQHSQTKFIKIYISQPNTDSTVYGLQYYTVYAHKAINITIQSYTGHISRSQESTIKEIVGSASFTASTQTAKSNFTSMELSMLELFISLIITISIYSLPIIIYRYRIRKKPVTAKVARKITIIYGIFAFIIMSVIIFSLTGNRIAGGAIVLWSIVNYHVLVSGQEKTKSVELPTDTTEDPLTNRAQSLDSISAMPRIQYCRKCGFKLIDGSNFCNNCGTPIEKG